MSDQSPLDSGPVQDQSADKPDPDIPVQDQSADEPDTQVPYNQETESDIPDKEEEVEDGGDPSVDAELLELHTSLEDDGKSPEDMEDLA